MMNTAKEALLRFCRSLRPYAMQMISAIGKGWSLSKGFMKKHRIPTAMISLALVLSMLMSVITVSIRKVTVFEDGKEIETYHAIAYDREAILNKTEIELHEKDEMVIQEIDGEILASITRAFPVTILADGKEHRIMTTCCTVAEALKEAGISLNEKDQISSDPKALVTKSAKLTIQRVTSETITETAEIPFETITERTNSLYEGQTKVKREGKNGKQINTYSVTYTDGKETGRELIGTEIIEEAEDKILLKGTKIRSSFKKTSSTPKTYKKAVAMEATAYVQGGTTASGLPARVGVVAVDPRVIPLGTKVYVETADGKYIYGTAIAADTGGAIKGNKIDICVGSEREARRFGRRIVNVYILG